MTYQLLTLVPGIEVCIIPCYFTLPCISAVITTYSSFYHCLVSTCCPTTPFTYACVLCHVTFILSANAEDMRLQLDLLVGKIRWRRGWQPTPVSQPAESHEQTSLMGYGPQGHEESDMTEVTQHTYNIIPFSY